MQKFKNIIHKIIKLLYGSDEDLSFTVETSLFLTGITLLLFAMNFGNKTREYEFLICLSSSCFFLWILVTQGINGFDKLLWGLFRFLLFFFLLFIALTIYLNLEKCSDPQFYGSASLMVIFFLLCFYYLIIKVKSIFRFFKKVFFQIRDRLFSVNRSSSNTRKFIENATSFLVLISGLLIAAKSIIEMIFQFFDYINKFFQ